MLSQGWVIKNPQLIVTSMCQTSESIAGIDQYHPDMRMEDGHFIKGSPELLASFRAQDKRVLASGIPSQSTALTQFLDGSWILTQNTKQRLPSGDLYYTFHNTPVDLLYLGWPAMLDHTTQRLLLPNNTHINAKDLTLLHRYLLGMPRKEMAAKYFVTVKAIEKRLTRLREQLDHPACQNLHDCLYRLGLIPFLLAHANWFALTSSHHIHLQK